MYIYVLMSVVLRGLYHAGSAFNFSKFLHGPTRLLSEEPACTQGFAVCIITCRLYLYCDSGLWKNSTTDSKLLVRQTVCVCKRCLDLFMRVLVNVGAVHLHDAVSVLQSCRLCWRPRLHLANELALLAALSLHVEPEATTVVPRSDVA